MSTELPEISLRLIRHAESEGNAGARTLDAASMRLTPKGIRQAEALAEREIAAPDLLICSPYRRALDSAAPLMRRFPAVPLETWPVEEFTPLAAAGWRNTTAADRRGAVDAYWQAMDPQRVEGPGAESFAGFLARVESAWQRLKALSGGTVLVVSHRKFMAALVFNVLSAERGVSARRMRQFRSFDQAVPIPNGARIDLRLRGPTVWVGPVDPLPVRCVGT